MQKIKCILFDVFGTVVDWRESIASEASIRGSLFGESLPRIVYFDGFHMDLNPTGKILLVYNKDIPGVIGKVGTLLGDMKVNIAGYQLGRKENSDIAIGIVRLDSEPSPNIIERISDLDEVISAKVVALD